MSTKIKIEIRSHITGKIIFEYEKENNTVAETVKEYVTIARADLRRANLSDADLRRANLSGANLSDADLSRADLRGANLSRANLRDADLRRANLSGANLRDADLSRANLEPIKNDLFIVLLHCLSEVGFLKRNIIEGKINGSTYEGECACLSGTLMNGAKLTDGHQEVRVIKAILSCRDPSRPIEQFFLGIKVGDTPEINPLSKLALEWVEEFEKLLTP